MMLESAISALTRDQIIALLTQPQVSLRTLRICACAALGGDPVVLADMLPEGTEETAPVAPKPVAPAAPKAPKPAAPKAPKPTAATPSSEGIDATIRALAPSGFSLDLAHKTANAAGIVCSKPQMARAIKNAVKAGVIASAGERRFARYGSDVATAQAASDSARSGG